MKTATTSRRVVVTGLGVVASIGHDVASFWSSLVAGRIGVDRVTLFDPSKFACQIGAEVRDWDVNQHMDPKEARRNDRYTHFGFVAAKQAVADSGIDMAREDGDRVGVIIGSGIGGMHTYETQLRILFERGPRKVSPFTIPSLIGNMCSGLVAIEFGARGPELRDRLGLRHGHPFARRGRPRDPPRRRRRDGGGGQRGGDHARSPTPRSAR